MIVTGLEPQQVLAFRLARHGLAARGARTLAEGLACPVSDFARHSALTALTARCLDVTREAYDRASDAGEIVVGLSLRAAFHALAPEDAALYGRALIAEDDAQLLEQLGPTAERQLREQGISALEALEEVTAAIVGALEARAPLSKDELHAELRERVRQPLLPWCKGCASHHVSPMLWRYGVVRTGARCDSLRRHLSPEPRPAPAAAEAVRRFLHFYGPGTPKGFAVWAGVARAHAKALWAEVEEELTEVRVEGRRAWQHAVDERALASVPPARGVRLLPPRDPYLQLPDRDLLTPDPEVRKRLFRPVAGPGAVLADGRLAGLWRARVRGTRIEIRVEALERIDPAELGAEAEAVARARGAREADIVWA